MVVIYEAIYIQLQVWPRSLCLYISNYSFVLKLYLTKNIEKARVRSNYSQFEVSIVLLQ